MQDWGFDDSAEEEERSEEEEEQDGEEGAYGCEIDWWSVGVTIYEVRWDVFPWIVRDPADDSLGFAASVWSSSLLRRIDRRDL